ncbi:MAG: hypothetical protein NT126_01240 [Bacteroidetes bacterium]|nr:hypothetical protein [Bacteroidota bacterium]
MKFILCLIISSVSISCTGQKKVAKNKCDERLVRSVGDNWKYNSSEDYYNVNKSFIKDLNSVYRDCINGKDSTFILKVFGNKTKSREKLFWVNPISKDTLISSIKYAISKPCGSSSVLNCEYYEFLFDKNGKLKKWEQFSEDIQRK